MMHREKKYLHAFLINVCCALNIVIRTIFKGSKNRPQKLPQKVCVCVCVLLVYVCMFAFLYA
jgi:hypothetical protein